MYYPLEKDWYLLQGVLLCFYGSLFYPLQKLKDRQSILQKSDMSVLIR